MFTDYTNSPVLNAKFQCHSIVVQVASKVFCECLYVQRQSNYGVSITEHESIWSEVVNRGVTKYYIS